MNLSSQQKHYLKDNRAELLDDTITVSTVTETGTGDFMGEGKTTTTTTQSVAARVGWGAVLEKNEQAGGYIEVGDCKVCISLTDKTKVDKAKTFITTSDGVALEIVKIQPAAITNECVLVCKRRQ